MHLLIQYERRHGRCFPNQSESEANTNKNGITMEYN